MPLCLRLSQNEDECLPKVGITLGPDLLWKVNTRLSVHVAPAPRKYYFTKLKSDSPDCIPFICPTSSSIHTVVIYERYIKLVYRLLEKYIMNIKLGYWFCSIHYMRYSLKLVAARKGCPIQDMNLFSFVPSVKTSTSYVCLFFFFKLNCDGTARRSLSFA